MATTVSYARLGKASQLGTSSVPFLMCWILFISSAAIAQTAVNQEQSSVLADPMTG